MSIRYLVPRHGRGGSSTLWPGNTLTQLEMEVDHMLGHPFLRTGQTILERDVLSETYTPAVDVQQTENEVRVMAELPGLNKKDIEIWVESDHLMLSGEKRSEQTKEDAGYYSTERRYGSFWRMIPLPSGVNFDKAEATFKNGILTVSMPKTEEAKRHQRKIEIKGE